MKFQSYKLWSYANSYLPKIELLRLKPGSYFSRMRQPQPQINKLLLFFEPHAAAACRCRMPLPHAAAALNTQYI